MELGEDDNGQIRVWVNALTSIEREECILDGAVAQAAERTLNGPGSTAYEAMLAELEKSDRDKIIEGLCLSRATEAWALGQDDLHADENWRGDRLLLIERMDAAIQAGMELSEEERTKLGELNEAYLADWRTKSQERVEAMRAEYRTQETRELIRSYMRAWTDSRALTAQADEYRVSQLFYGTRVCRARKLDDDSYDHSECAEHNQLVFPDRRSVRMAPDALIQILVPVADRIDREGADALGKR